MLTLGKLGNPEGEVVFTRAAHTHDAIQMVGPTGEILILKFLYRYRLSPLFM
ncbi:hypothetical protein L211DRAFT_862269 [Terfezia boudieri ATCC MYA-4762]|uniref:Uncharacterized protein n=1 Tax=Terfezia boudieri ATCC MYA-4762 TaxID=1051890 RepID=A0A3N4LPQ8_9PEZI|nr:hypothetical protein L211DRAFT_862269 [Terfezia boudieri ATCC MYA-4762]